MGIGPGKGGSGDGGGTTTINVAEHFDARDGRLPAIASNGNDDEKVGIANGGTYRVIIDPIPASDATADSWASFVNANYLGEFDDDDDVTSPQIEHFYWSIRRRHLRIYMLIVEGSGLAPHLVERFVTFEPGETNYPPNFIGGYDTRQDALDAAEYHGIEVGENFTAFTGTDLETATNFTPSEDGTNLWRHWLFVPDEAVTGVRIKGDGIFDPLDFANGTAGMLNGYDADGAPVEIINSGVAGFSFSESGGTLSILRRDGGSNGLFRSGLQSFFGLKFVTSLPNEADVPNADLGKFHIVRADATSPISLFAHLKETNAKVGFFTAAVDPTSNSRVGFDGEDYGHHDLNINITSIREVLGSGGVYNITVAVAAAGTIPRENVTKSIYFRERGSTGNWRGFDMIAGADGVYDSLSYNGSGDYIVAGTEYEFVVRAGLITGSEGSEVASPPSDNQYDVWPQGVKWAEFPDLEDLSELGHIRIIINQARDATRNKADSDLQNIDDDLTDDEKSVIKTRLSITDASTGTTYTIGPTFPTSPSLDDIHEFDAAASELTARNSDDTATVSDAAIGDRFEFTASEGGADQWIQKRSIGSGTGDASGKADSDLQNVDDDLTETEQSTVRQRLGIEEYELIDSNEVRGQKVADITFGGRNSPNIYRHISSSGFEELTATEISSSTTNWVLDDDKPDGFTIATTVKLNVPRERSVGGMFGFVAQIEVLKEIGRLSTTLTTSATDVVFAAAPTSLGVNQAIRIEDEILIVESVPASDATGVAARTFGVSRTNAVSHSAGVIIQNNFYELVDEGLLIHGAGSPQQGGSTNRSAVVLDTFAEFDSSGLPEVAVQLVNERATSSLHPRAYIRLATPDDDINVLPHSKISIYLAIAGEQGIDIIEIDGTDLPEPTFDRVGKFYKNKRSNAVWTVDAHREGLTDHAGTFTLHTNANFVGVRYKEPPISANRWYISSKDEVIYKSNLNHYSATVISGFPGSGTNPTLMGFFETEKQALDARADHPSSDAHTDYFAVIKGKLYRLDDNSFVQASFAGWQYRWRIYRPDTGIIFVSDQGLPTASEATMGREFVDPIDGKSWTTQILFSATANPTGTFANIATSYTVGGNTFTYKGALDLDPLMSNLNDFFYNKKFHSWMKNTPGQGGYGSVSIQDAFQTTDVINWLGEADSVAGALLRIDEIDTNQRYMALITDALQELDVTTFVAATGRLKRYVWSSQISEAETSEQTGAALQEQSVGQAEIATLAVYTRSTSDIDDIDDPTYAWADDGLEGQSDSVWEQDEGDLTGADPLFVATATAVKADGATTWTQTSWVKQFIGESFPREYTDDPDSTSGDTVKTDDHSYTRFRLTDGHWSEWIPIGNRVVENFTQYVRLGTTGMTLTHSGDGIYNLNPPVDISGYKTLRIGARRFTSWTNWNDGIWDDYAEGFINLDHYNPGPYASDGTNIDYSPLQGGIYCRFAKGDTEVSLTDGVVTGGGEDDVRFHCVLMRPSGAFASDMRIAKIRFANVNVSWKKMKIDLHLRKY